MQYPIYSAHAHRAKSITLFFFFFVGWERTVWSLFVPHFSLFSTDACKPCSAGENVEGGFSAATKYKC